MMELSVVIPTLRRPGYLAEALASFAGQTFARDRFEALVVNNASDDETAGIAERFMGTIPNLRYIVEPSPGLHNARHRGMREARSDRLVFVDDDIEAFPGWLEGVWEGFVHHGAVMVGGKNLPKWGSEPPEWLIRLWTAGGDDNRSLGYLSILDFGDSIRDIDPSCIWGCNFAIERSVLLAAGGFHPDAMPDGLLRFRGDGESHVSRYVAAQGLKAVYTPRASVYHKVPGSRMTLTYFRKRAFSQGISDSYSTIRGWGGGRRPTLGARVFGRFLRGGLFDHFFSQVLPTGRFIGMILEDSYWQGYRWHAGQFATDASLRDWVLRRDYQEP